MYVLHYIYHSNCKLSSEVYIYIINRFVRTHCQKQEVAPVFSNIHKTGARPCMFCQDDSRQKNMQCK